MLGVLGLWVVNPSGRGGGCRPEGFFCREIEIESDKPFGSGGEEMVGRRPEGFGVGFLGFVGVKPFGSGGGEDPKGLGVGF